MNELPTTPFIRYTADERNNINATKLAWDIEKKLNEEHDDVFNWLKKHIEKKLHLSSFQADEVIFHYKRFLAIKISNEDYDGKYLGA